MDTASAENIVRDAADKPELISSQLTPPNEDIVCSESRDEASVSSSHAKSMKQEKQRKIQCENSNRVSRVELTGEALINEKINKENAEEVIFNNIIEGNDDEAELELAIAELSEAIRRNPTLTKVQREFFQDLAENPPNDASVGTQSTTSSINSLRRATMFVREECEHSISKESLKRPKAATRDTSLHKNLWQAHSKRVAPKNVLQRIEKRHSQRELGVPDMGRYDRSKNEAPERRSRVDSASFDGIIREKLQPLTADEIATPRRSNIQGEQGADIKLPEPESIKEFGLVMPDFENDNSTDANESAEIKAEVSVEDEDYSVSDSLLTDDNSLFDDLRASANSKNRWSFISDTDGDVSDLENSFRERRPPLSCRKKSAETKLDLDNAVHDKKTFIVHEDEGDLSDLESSFRRRKPPMSLQKKAFSDRALGGSRTFFVQKDNGDISDLESSFRSRNPPLAFKKKDDHVIPASTTTEEIQVQDTNIEVVKSQPPHTPDNEKPKKIEIIGTSKLENQRFNFRSGGIENVKDDENNMIEDDLSSFNASDNSLLDSYNEGSLKPHTTVLFPSDKIPSSLASVVRRSQEEFNNHGFTRGGIHKSSPSLRHANVVFFDTTCQAGSIERRSFPRRFTFPLIASIEEEAEGFEIIPGGYNYDDDSLCDESISSYHPASSILLRRDDASLCSVPSLHRTYAADDQSITKSVSSIPSLHRTYAADDQSLRGSVSSIPSLHRAFAKDEQSIQSSAMDFNKFFQNTCSLDVNGQDILGDDLTDGSTIATNDKNPQPYFRHNNSATEDDSSTLCSKKVSFTTVSAKTKEEYFLDNSTGAPVDQTRDDDEQSTTSWTIETEGTENNHHYDAWDIYNDEYCEDEAAELPFEIFGTSAEDVSSQPHVLSPPLMDSLRNFIPERLFHQNYWLKYSLIRDGASMQILLRSIRGSKYTLLAIETTKGDVFGCFTSTVWKKNNNFFGSGESFVWKMKHNRCEPSFSVVDQVKKEAEIEVFAFSNENDMVQICKPNFIAIGGGTLDNPASSPNLFNVDTDGAAVETGFAIALDDELLKGTTTPCATFLSPCLIDSKSKTGEIFEVVNMEAWTYSPCHTEEQAERNELALMFREGSEDMDVIGSFIVGSRSLGRV